MTQATDQKVVEFVSTTPSGIEVKYQAEPKRAYWIYDPGQPEKGWVEVPSVTTVLGVLDKPALPYWGMRVGIEGVISVFNLGLLHKAVTPGGQPVLAINTTEGFVAAGVSEIEALLVKHHLTVNHVRDKAGSRGTAVHDALEAWAATREIPDPTIFPPQEQGYVAGLAAFLRDVPTAEPEAAEVMVGSAEHGFAGRYDLRIKTAEEHQVVFHRTPVRGPQYAKLAAGRYLTDLKTSSGVYLSHYRQLEAYEGASVECGYEPTDGRGVIHVNADGTYEFVRSDAVYEDFLCVLAVWNSDESIKQRAKARKEASK